MPVVAVWHPLESILDRLNPWRSVRGGAVPEHPDLRRERRLQYLGLLFFFGAVAFGLAVIFGGPVLFLPVDWANYTKLTGVARWQADAHMVTYGLLVLGLAVMAGTYMVWRRDLRRFRF